MYGVHTYVLTYFAEPVFDVFCEWCCNLVMFFVLVKGGWVLQPMKKWRRARIVAKITSFRLAEGPSDRDEAGNRDEFFDSLAITILFLTCRRKVKGN